VGTVPGRDLARALSAWIAPASRDGWHGLPASVTATTGTSPDGRRVHIVHNWSWEPARVQVPVDLADVLTDDSVPAGTLLDLDPWDVRVLVSAGTTPSL
jgi:beta-galactosidase